MLYLQVVMPEGVRVIGDGAGKVRVTSYSHF